MQQVIFPVLLSFLCEESENTGWRQSDIVAMQL